MSALDRLENYSARKKAVDSEVFDIKTPEGAFLQLVHNKGYKMYNEDGSYTELYTALTTEGNQRIQAIAGSGKALVNGTKIMTPDGLKPIETLKIGDMVFGEDGRGHKVQGVFPQGKKRVYQIYLNNGGIVECCKDHLWTVTCADGKKRTITTLEMYNEPSSYTLPKVRPLQFNNKIVTSDSEMQSHINYITPDDYVVPKAVCYGTVGYRRQFVERYKKQGGSPLPLVPVLSTLGLYLTEIESDSYTIEDRLEITQIKCTSKEREMTCISIDSPSHLYLIEGGIPTHNTTMLIFKIMHDLVTGETMRNQMLPNGQVVSVVDKVFVGTFLRSGADELRTKLAQWQRALGYRVTAESVHFGTLHAEFKRCLNEMGVATPIGSANVLNGLLRRAINMCNITREGEQLKQDDYKIIESVLMYYRGRLDDKRYQHPSARDYGLTPSIIELLNRQYSQLKQTEGIMDFEDLQELLYKYLYLTPNPNVQDFCANRYNHIYLDEFQDTSQIQYAILKAYGRGWLKDTQQPSKGKIVVVGDVEQCIYSFRGSDIGVMHKDFNNDFEPTNNSLSYNYRCPSNILMPVVDSINLNLEAKGIDIKAYNEGGIFNSYGFYNVSEMLKHLEKDLDYDIDNDMNIGILCRTNYDGMIPALFLEMLGKYKFSISGDAMTLNSALPRRILKVARLLTEKCTPAVKDVLSMFVTWRDQWAVKKVCDVLKQNRLSIWDMNEEDLKYECPALYGIILEFKLVRKKHNGDDIMVLQYMYNKLKKDIFGSDSQYCLSARACIETFQFYLNFKKFSTVHEFLDEMDDLNERLQARVGKNYGISISTVHEFKGKERDSIYVWNDSEGVFPSPKTDLKELSQVEEERRVHYIACTRARCKSTIYSLMGSTGMFLNEMDCKTTPVTSHIQGSI